MASSVGRAPGWFRFVLGRTPPAPCRCPATRCHAAGDDAKPQQPRWGTERIRGELLKLGLVVSNRSIRRYRWRPIRPGDHQRWSTFLTTQVRGVWAADLFVVQTVSYQDRPHRSLQLRSPIIRPSQHTGRVVSRSVLGGLHHVYARAA